MRGIYETLCRLGSEKAALNFDPKLSAAYTLERDPFELDLLTLLPLDNMEFIETLYLTLFNRTLEEKARKAWEQKKDWPKERFQSTAVNALLASAEYRRIGVRVKNNIYLKSVQLAAPMLSDQRNGAWQRVKDIMKKTLQCVGLLEPARRIKKLLS